MTSFSTVHFLAEVTGIDNGLNLWERHVLVTIVARESIVLLINFTVKIVRNS